MPCQANVENILLYADSDDSDPFRRTCCHCYSTRIIQDETPQRDNCLNLTCFHKYCRVCPHAWIWNQWACWAHGYPQDPVSGRCGREWICAMDGSWLEKQDVTCYEEDSIRKKLKEPGITEEERMQLEADLEKSKEARKTGEELGRLGRMGTDHHDPAPTLDEPDLGERTINLEELRALFPKPLHG